MSEINIIPKPTYQKIESGNTNLLSIEKIITQTDNIDEIATCKPRCRLFNGKTLISFPDCCQLQFVNKPTVAKCTGCILTALFGVFAILFALFAALISS